MRKLLLPFLIAFCFTKASAQQGWVYLKGNASDFLDVYGVLGQYHPNNSPGLRLGGITWTYDGKLYFFGGNTYSNSGSVGPKDDIWQYDTLSRNWRWIKGSKSINTVAVYGTKGTEAATNTPGAKRSCASWVYNSKVYVFGGGTDEMWQYDPATNNWTWLNGNDGNSKAIYGTKGVANITNQPGARNSCAFWQYNNKLYIYGGNGFDSINNGVLNDIWEYDPATNIWTWVNGDKLVGASLVQGTQGVAAVSNNPGARSEYNWWFLNGKFYRMGGGTGFISSSFNEIWEYDMTTNLWTWIKGIIWSQPPVYGTKGVANSLNTPGGRLNATTWTANGKLYLLGGDLSQGATDDIKDDMWEFDPSTNNWTWLQGTQLTGQKSSYGYLGAFSVSNYIGSRRSCHKWEFANKVYIMGGNYEQANVFDNTANDVWEHNFSTKQWRWLKGMHNPASKSVYGYRGVENYLSSPSDRYGAMRWQTGDSVYMYCGWGVHDDVLWRYNINTNNWTIVKGFVSDTAVYNAKGTYDKGNTPGKLRDASATWMHNNKLYLFSGGNGWTDLWCFDIATNNWALLKDNGRSRLPSYGVKGTAAATNVPGYRYDAATWTVNGKFYLFGGEGIDKNGDGGYLNDLWMYDPVTNNWTWLKGSDTRNPDGVYGTQGTAASTNTPGGRQYAASCVINNKLYMYGGFGHASSLGFPSSGYLNDVWEYDIATNNWRNMKGNDYGDAPTVFGTKGVAAATNKPGSKIKMQLWANNGKMYLFGGVGYITKPSGGFTNDLWEYDPATNNWTWIGGSNQYSQDGYYDIAGIPGPDNMPGARYYAATWVYNNRLYFFGGGAYPANATYIISEIKNDIWYYETCTTPSLCYTSAPTVSLGKTIELCNSMPLILNAGNIGSRFLWNTGDTTQSIAVSAAGKYWVRVTNPANLSSSDTVTVVTALLPVTNIGNDTIACNTIPLLLDAGNPGMAYFWNTGEATRSIVPKASGIYTVSVVKSNSCFAYDTVKVKINPTPDKPDAIANTPLCEGDTLHLKGRISAGSLSATWTGPGGFASQLLDTDINSIGLSAAGNYILTDSLEGCKAYDTIRVDVKPIVLPTVSIAASTTPIGPWSPIIFTTTPVNGGTAPTYQWQKNWTDIPGATSNTYNTVTTADILDHDFICVIMTSNEACASTRIVNSNCIETLINLSVPNLNVNNSIAVYPNPNNGNFTIKGELGNAPVFIGVYDMLGQQIYYKELLPLNGMLNEFVDLRSLSNGIYLLKAKSDDKIYSAKFTVNK